MRERQLVIGRREQSQHIAAHPVLMTGDAEVYQSLHEVRGTPKLPHKLYCAPYADNGEARSLPDSLHEVTGTPIAPHGYGTAAGHDVVPHFLPAMTRDSNAFHRFWGPLRPRRLPVSCRVSRESPRPLRCTPPCRLPPRADSTGHKQPTTRRRTGPPHLGSLRTTWGMRRPLRYNRRTTGQSRILRAGEDAKQRRRRWQWRILSPPCLPRRPRFLRWPVLSFCLVAL